MVVTDYMGVEIDTLKTWKELPSFYEGSREAGQRRKV